MTMEVNVLTTTRTFPPNYLLISLNKLILMTSIMLTFTEHRFHRFTCVSTWAFYSFGTGRRGVIFDRNAGLIFIAQINLVDSKQ